MTVVKNRESDRSLETLLEELQPRLRGVLATFRIPFEDAEDLLQQSVLTYLHKREHINDPARWLIGTLRNRCLMYWRSHRRRLYESVDVAILESVAPPERPSQEQDDLSRDLNRVLAKMPERCRSLLHLRYAMGCEPAEAAHQMGYRPSSIYKILERCLAGLTRRLVAVGIVEPQSAVSKPRRPAGLPPPAD